MKNGKTLAVLAVILAIALLSAAFALTAFADEGADPNRVWTFTADTKKDPLYVQNYFTSLPRAFEAEVNFSSSYSVSSPIIANYPAYNTRNCFGFQISSDGKPSIYYYETYYNAETWTTECIKDMIKFNYNVYGKGWVRLTVVNEIVEEVVAGETVRTPVYKLYVDGVLTDTVTSYTTVREFDVIDSQNATRELSIGCDATNHFRGELRNVAVYQNAVSKADATVPAKTHMENKNSNLLAYYDATMAGNKTDYLKDQTGNKHDAYKAFYERDKALGDYAYSFAFIGDTQFLVFKDAMVNEDTPRETPLNQYAYPIYEWLVNNKDSKNIQHVFGLGDITDKTKNAEWQYGADLYGMLEKAEIPFSTIVGNHDQAEKYNTYFGKLNSLVNSISGTYEAGKLENYYTKFEVGGHKYMVVGLEYGAKDEILAWANTVVASNPDRRVIVMTHSLFDANGNWGQIDTSSETTTKGNDWRNNGIDIWNDFISQHENIILAVAGHITSNFYHPRQYVGVNGNIVNTLLIDPQGFDKANAYDTGLVAMFYFSEDGSKVHVECVSTSKTVRAQDADPTSGDILFSTKNQYDFEIDFRKAEGSYERTVYGKLPTICYDQGHKFAMFSGGEFIAGYTTWTSATAAVGAYFKANPTAEVQLRMLDDYAAGDGVTNSAFAQANTKLTIDLNGHTFVRNGTFLNFNISEAENISNVAPSNIVLKNGTVLTPGKPIIDNQITNKTYAQEKVWNLTVEGVTFGFVEGANAADGAFYQAWTNSATADEAQLGAKTNIVFNNCTFDLKTNAPSGTVKLFTLKDDHSQISKVDVSVTINGGKILSENVDYFKGVTFYTVNTGDDSITFGEYNGEYTKLITAATEKYYAHYSKAMPAADGDRYFVEISDNGTESVYELQSLTMTFDSMDKQSTISGTVSLGTDNANVKYLSAVDYPFVLFDQTGKFYMAYELFLGNGLNTHALAGAIYKVTNTGASKPTANTAYLLMRADYTLTSSEKIDNISHGRVGGVVVDMCGYSLIADSTRSTDWAKGSIFNLNIKQWTDSGDGIYTFPTKFIVRNGDIKTYRSAILYTKAINQTTVKVDEVDTKVAVDLSAKVVDWTFDGVTFGLLPGSTTPRFFHVAGASNSSSTVNMPTLNLNFNDCTFDVATVVPTASEFVVMTVNYDIIARIKANVRVNGGKVLAEKLDNLTLENFFLDRDKSGNVINGGMLYYGTGSDGKYLSVVLPKGVSVEKFNASTLSTVAGTELTFIKSYEWGGNVTYTLMPKSASSITFAPKSSITLGSELIYNIYIPKVDYLKSFTVNGVAYPDAELVTLDDGDQYYRVRVTIPAYEACNDVVLKATVVSGDKDYNGIWDLSIPVYAKSVIDANASREGVALAKDVLSYIKAAYAYFGKDSDKLSAISDILGASYDGSNAPDMSASANAPAPSGTGFTGVTLHLGDAPSYRFYYNGTAPDYTFKVGSRTVAPTCGSDAKGTYLEIKVYAYEMLLGVSFGDYSYSVYAYYNFAREYALSREMALVERLVKYCESANAYRESVKDAN